MQNQWGELIRLEDLLAKQEQQYGGGQEVLKYN